eukprot:CAMPEP_0174821238 /NCGR_PEP_ID=MMETSP1107-20130205/6086_1 /TAXON_ID=36770 /ORGANISM="Paraphysomonas vestita, Strain GFlagA" /LENGTH=342 /DNA_ID=CAMNT_0016038041 /DNA_START=117 /DNA_END=1145 /DNA_ORIENTATION=+
MAVSGRDLEDGDKILLPQSALESLARMNVEYPMLFKLENNSMGRSTHCGVYEFSAPEGCCYLPFWMMQNLMIGEGTTIIVKNVSLPKAKFVKFRPQSVDFLEISNPRAVLEKTLRNYTCVTNGDQICIHYLNRNLYLEVVEVKPGGAASIVETDCEVDFAEPVGYVPPPKPSSNTSSSSISSSSSSSSTTTTSNNNNNNNSSSSSNTGNSNNGTPSTTPRNVQKARAADEAVQQQEDSKKFKPFTGKAMRIDGRNTTSSPTTTTTSTSPSTTSLSTTLTSPSSLSSSSTSSSTAPSLPSQSPSANAAAAAISRQSLVGNKYSTKKVAVSAFNGKASTLSGSK